MGDDLKQAGVVLGQTQGNCSAKEFLVCAEALALVTACKVSSGPVEYPEHRHNQNEHFKNAKQQHRMHQFKRPV
jgi:hypothetical protein